MKQLLLIEDDAMVADLVTMLLSEEGYSVEWAPTATAGYGYLRHTRPALILLDLTLPDMNGSAVLQYCKAAGRLRDIPIVVMSGVSPSQVMFSDGATPDAIIRKPFDIDEVLNIVNGLVEQSVAYISSPCVSAPCASVERL